MSDGGAHAAPIIGHLRETRTMLRGTAAVFGIRSAALALGVVVHLAIARLYGAETLGLYSLAVVLALTAALVGRIGTDRSIVRFVAGDVAGDPAAAGTVLGRVVSLTLPLSTVVAVALWLAAPWLAAGWFGDAALGPPLRALALSVPAFNLLAAFAGAFQGMQRVLTWALARELLPNLLTLLALLAATALADRDPLFPAASRALGYAAGAAGALLLWRGLGGRIEVRGAAGPGSAELLRVSGPMLGTAALYWILGWTDLVMLGALAEASEVGIYRAAGNFATAIAFARPAVQSVTMPRMAAAWASGDRPRMGEVTRLSARAGFALTALAGVPVMLLAAPLLALFGEDFVAGRVCLILLCLGQLVIASCGSAGYVLDMIGEERSLRSAVLAAAVLNLVLNVAWIPTWGINGAAAASLCGAALWSGLAAAGAWRKLAMWVGVR